MNANGIKLAELLGQRWSDQEITAIYSSPLRRALDTAAIVAGHHDLEPQIVEGLIDIDYGRWQGLPHQRVGEEYPELHRRWQEEPHQVRMPQGESLEDVRKRQIYPHRP